MARTLANLASSLRKRIPAIEAAGNRAKIRVAETILGDLVFVTPVDTSRALSNWQVTLDAPVPSSINPYFPGSSGSTRIASANEALSVGRRILATAKPGQHVFLGNVVPYIRRLNDGYSKQAPAGFVERAVLVGRRFLERYRINFNGR